jgi:hypothetical protein
LWLAEVGKGGRGVRRKRDAEGYGGGGSGSGGGGGGYGGGGGGGDNCDIVKLEADQRGNHRSTVITFSVLCNLHILHAWTKYL